MKLTKFELEVMDALWALGAASIREVHEALPKSKRVAYTTVQTIVGRLEEKGAVRRVKKIGNAFIFEPTVERQAVHRRLVDEFLALLGGARPLMSHLVETGKLSLDDLRELEASLAERPAEKSDGRKKR
jgi:BlaI family transcriptional regulator, penicillinase repressor